MHANPSTQKSTQKKRSARGAGVDAACATKTHGALRHKLALAALLASSSWGVQALTLGAVQVRSTLGQALSARVAVPQLTAAEASSLTLTLGTAADYAAAGLPYDSVLAGARIALVPASKGAQPHIEISGTQPVREPLVNLIVSAQWASGRITRNYALLIDPPGGVAPTRAATVRPVAAAPARPPLPVISKAVPPLASTASGTAGTLPAPGIGAAPAVSAARIPAGRNDGPQERVRQISAPRHVLRPPQRAHPTATAATAMTTTAAVPPRSAAPTARRRTEPATGEPTDKVKVRRGDTASKLVQRHGAAGATLDQLLAAFLRANPSAFIGGDINRLRAGARVRLPTAEEASRLPAQEARALIRASSRQFASRRSQSAGHAIATASESASRPSPGGKVHRAPAETAPAADKLADRLGASRETLADAQADANAHAVQRELAALSERIAELEGRLNALRLQQSAAAAGARQPLDNRAASTKTPAKDREMLAVSAATADSRADLAAAQPAKSATEPASMELASRTTTVLPHAPNPDDTAAPARPRDTASERALVVRTSAMVQREPAAAQPWYAALRDIPRNAWLAPLLLLLAAGYLLGKKRQNKEADGAGAAFLDGAMTHDGPPPPGPAPSNAGTVAQGAAAPSFPLGDWVVGRVKAKPVGKDSNPCPLLSGDSPAIARETGAEWGFSPPVAADGFLRPKLLDAVSHETARPATPSHGVPTSALPPATAAGAVSAQVRLATAAASRGDAASFGQSARALHRLTGGAGNAWATVAALGRLLDPEQALYRIPATAERARHALAPDTPAPPASDFSVPDPGRNGMPGDASSVVPSDEWTKIELQERHQPASPPLSDTAPAALSFPDLALEAAEPAPAPTPLFELLQGSPAAAPRPAPAPHP